MRPRLNLFSESIRAPDDPTDFLSLSLFSLPFSPCSMHMHIIIPWCEITNTKRKKGEPAVEEGRKKRWRDLGRNSSASCLLSVPFPASFCPRGGRSFDFFAAVGAPATTMMTTTTEATFSPFYPRGRSICMSHTRRHYGRSLGMKDDIFLEYPTISHFLQVTRLLSRQGTRSRHSYINAQIFINLLLLLY